MQQKNERIVVVGLGYVGLPLAVALARKFEGVIGFDISEKRVAALAVGRDWTGEVEESALAETRLDVTDDPDRLAEASFIIVTVPTPIDADNRPDLGPIESACALIAPRLRGGALVVFESTVYPGVTEDICGPLLEAGSGLARGQDFFLGYSPERINPGDREHRIETIVKIVAAENDASLARMRVVYGAIVEAGLHVAPTIRVAEAAKVIENTQRDLNIALMNELSLIFDRMDIRTGDVLAAAGTKWNFIPFRPGLVGGHCIGVDPFYLTTAAEQLGYRPEVILAGRSINDSMSGHVARKTIALLGEAGRAVAGARIGIFGLTFKEDVPDLRNSKVPEIVRELASHRAEVLVHDPIADPAEAEHEYGLALTPLEDMRGLDALIIAVAHRDYGDAAAMLARLDGRGVFVDVKSAFDPAAIGDRARYWSL